MNAITEHIKKIISTDKEVVIETTADNGPSRYAWVYNIPDSRSDAPE